MNKAKILRGLPPRKSGVRDKIRDGLGDAKELREALNVALDKKGLRLPQGSNFGAKKFSRWVE
jgi:hypothetical protein